MYRGEVDMIHCHNKHLLLFQNFILFVEKFKNKKFIYHKYHHKNQVKIHYWHHIVIWICCLDIHLHHNKILFLFWKLKINKIIKIKRIKTYHILHCIDSCREWTMCMEHDWRRAQHVAYTSSLDNTHHTTLHTTRSARMIATQSIAGTASAHPPTIMPPQQAPNIKYFELKLDWK